MGPALAGQTRGRKRKAPHPVTVRFTYERNLLRLRAAVDFLKRSRRGTSSESLVEKVADACDVPFERFRLFLGIYGEAQGQRQNLTSEARTWAANENGITAQRVSNILSELRSRSR